MDFVSIGPVIPPNPFRPFTRKHIRLVSSTYTTLRITEAESRAVCCITRTECARCCRSDRALPTRQGTARNPRKQTAPRLRHKYPSAPNDRAQLQHASLTLALPMLRVAQWNPRETEHLAQPYQTPTRRSDLSHCDACTWWRKDSNLRRPESTDLQSVAVDRLATPPAVPALPLGRQPALRPARADGENRTRNRLITNQVLCQLSYVSLTIPRPPRAPQPIPASPHHQPG